jgi:hypothetical protein
MSELTGPARVSSNARQHEFMTQPILQFRDKRKLQVSADWPTRMGTMLAVDLQ